MSFTTQSTAARRFLLAARNSNGAWPYVPGKPAAPEPTCYAMLALTPSPSDSHVDWKPSIAWLQTAQNGTARSSWTRSIELLTLSWLNAMPEVRRKLAERLLEFRVRQFTAEGPNELDGKLRGWAWFDDTFSWVEPTSYALLALKASGYGQHARVAEAERLLLDRVCADGGWNYGNKKVLGAEVPSMPADTALAAMALQNTTAAAARIKPALDLLEREVLAYPSALSLSLAILSFNVFGKPVHKLADALMRRQASDGSWARQVHLTALSLLALQVNAGGTNVFKLG